MPRSMEKKEPDEIMVETTNEGVVINVVIFRKEKKNKRGRASYVLTDDGAKYISKLASFGCLKEEIAGELGVSFDTLLNETNRDKVDEAYKKGQARFKTSIRVNQTKIMKRGSASMAIFLGKNYLGQKDTITQEIPATGLSDFAKAMQEYKDDAD